MKNNRIKKIGFLLLIAIGFGCTPLNTITSNNNNTGFPSTFRYYDSDSKVSYAVVNTNEYIHLRLKVRDNTSIMKIVRAGLTVYFDVEGKKKTNVGLNYPIKNAQGSRPEMNGKPGKLENKDKRLQTMVGMIPTTASFTFFEQNTHFSVLDSTGKFKVQLTVNDNNELLYDLKVPIKEISKLGIESLTNLSIGVESGELEMPSRPSGGAGGNSGPPSGGGGRGSGGGGHGGGGRGDSQGGSPPSGAGGMDTTKKIEFWFKVDLFEE